MSTEVEEFEYPLGESYFNLEGDRELYTSESEDSHHIFPLSWRHDPEVTLSDWRIIVVTKSHKPKAYHVHRSVLSNGPRSSKYFTKLFANKCKGGSSKFLRNNSIVSNETSTKMELDDRDARNIPEMLDFIYADARMPSVGCGGTVATAASSVVSSMSFPLHSNSSIDDDLSISLGHTINTNNAVSLRHLSRLFGCDTLTLAINKFIQRDLTFRTGPIYFKHAYEYQDDRLLQAAKRLCSENFEQISVASIMRLPIKLFKELIESLGCEDKQSDSLSLVVSEVVYLYLEKHSEYFTAKNLVELTDPLIMPKIGPEPAIGFTALVKDLDAQGTTDNWDRLVDLCKRCAESVVGEFGWTDFSVQSALDEYLVASSKGKQSRVESLLFATSFAAALQRAQEEHSSVAHDSQNHKQQIHDLKQLVSQLERSNKRKEKHVDAQKQSLEEARRQIMYLKKKLNEARHR